MYLVDILTVVWYTSLWNSMVYFTERWHGGLTEWRNWRNGGKTIAEKVVDNKGKADNLKTSIFQKLQQNDCNLHAISIGNRVVLRKIKI